MKKAMTLALLGALAIGPAMAAGMSEKSSSDSNWQQSQSSRSQKHSSSRMDQNTARQVQQQLQQQGYDVGSVDGRWGPKSQQALTSFQRDQNLQPSGRPDQQTMAALGVGQGASQQAQTPNERQRSQQRSMGQSPSQSQGQYPNQGQMQSPQD